MSVTDCVPCKVCDQIAHRQRIVAHGHQRVLVFHTFGSKEKGFHVKVCMQQETTTPTTNKKAWRVIFIWSYQDQDHQTKKELRKKTAFQSFQPLQPLDPVGSQSLHLQMTPTQSPWLQSSSWH